VSYKEIVLVVCMQEASPEPAGWNFKLQAREKELLIFAKTLKNAQCAPIPN
jgi:hypothetical protein